MLKSCNIYIIVSPLQLLNCIELCIKLQTQNNILLIMQTDEKNNAMHIQQLLNFFTWDRIIYLKYPQKTIEKIFFPMVIKNTLKNFFHKNKIERVIVGEYRSTYLTHMVNSLNFHEVLLVDDGTAILSYDTYMSNGIKRNLYQKLFFNLKALNYIFFSIFDIEKMNLIKNDYFYIKKFMKEKKESNTVLFIGQPLIELQIISENEYKKNLVKIFEQYQNKDIVYILHRRQNENIIKRLSDEIGFEYKRYDQVVEIELLEAEALPLEVLTFYSTAIMTLPKLFNKIRFKAFKINENSLKNSQYSKHIENSYQEFRKNAIEVVEL